MFNFNTPSSTAGTSTFGGGFGSTPQQPASTSFFGSGFGNPAPAAASTGMFGAQPAAAAPSTGFFSGFGQPQPQQQTAAPTSTSLFSGFGQGQQPTTSAFGTNNMFNLTQTQPQTQAQTQAQTQTQVQTQTAEADYATRLAACVQNPFLFGDDRDQVLAKFNSVQATMGCGKAYYAPNQPPLVMNPENVFCKWKCVVYKPKRDYISEDGVVRLVFNKSGADVYDVRGALAELVHKLLGERPNIQVEIDGVNPLPNNKSELMLHVLERQNDGNVRRVPAPELQAFLLQPQQKTNLEAMNVLNVQTKFNLTKNVEKEYLEKVPFGMSSYFWFQAQKENPDNLELIPVPVLGFEEMFEMLKKEEALASLSKKVCLQIALDVKRLERKVEENKQSALSCQEKLDRLVLRQLHVSSTQPIISRIGQPLTAFETNLCDHVNQMKNLMEAPERNLKNRAQELTANIQLHDRYLTERAKRQPRIDVKSLTETEKEDMAKASELLLSVLDACKEKIRQEKEMLLKLMYEDSSAAT